MKSEYGAEHNGMGRTYFACLVLLVGILPMSGTIALRNLLLVVLAGMFCVSLVAGKHKPLGLGLADVPRSVRLWVLYLSVFPLFAMQSQEAFRHVLDEWLDLLVAGVVGWGAVVLCGGRGPSLLVLAIANSVPALLNLILGLAALAGWLSNDFYAEPGLATAWNALLHSNPRADYPALTLPQLLVGFRGVEPMHGNIGYSACQALVLYAAYIMTVFHSGQRARLWLAFLGAGMCLLGIFVAQSRGAIIFAVLIVLAALALYLRACRHHASRLCRSPVLVPKWHALWRSRCVVILAVAAGAVVSLHVAQHDPRWTTMADKVVLGMEVPDPVATLCNGVSPQDEAWIRKRFSDHDPAQVNEIIQGLKLQDGGRILLMRAGLQLVQENPRGVDGSRHTFKNLLEAKCGHAPVLAFSHAHNAWIDLTLALGWAGTGLFALAMLTLLRDAWHGIGRNAQDGWSLALLLLTAFWLLRGVADSVYREHFMQMQWLLMMYLYARARLVRYSTTAAGI